MYHLTYFPRAIVEGGFGVDLDVRKRIGQGNMRLCQVSIITQKPDGLTLPMTADYLPKAFWRRRDLIAPPMPVHDRAEGHYSALPLN